MWSTKYVFFWIILFLSLLKLPDVSFGHVMVSKLLYSVGELGAWIDSWHLLALIPKRAVLLLCFTLASLKILFCFFVKRSVCFQLWQRNISAFFYKDLSSDMGGRRVKYRILCIIFTSEIVYLPYIIQKFLTTFYEKVMSTSYFINFYV